MNSDLGLLNEKTQKRSFLTERQSSILRKVLGFLLIYFLIFLINFSFQLNTLLNLFYVNTDIIKVDKGNDDNSLRSLYARWGKKKICMPKNLLNIISN